jgi:putative spermidine/putrescine transport system permease protein
MARPSLLARIAFAILIAAIALFLMAPTLVVIPISFTTTSIAQFPPVGFSFQWYANVIHDPVWRSATATSLQIATLTVILSVVIGTAAALSLHRGDFAGKAVIRAILLSPLVTPVIVLAIGIFMVFARWGLAGTVPGLVIAHTVLALPFVIVAVTATLHGVNPNLELAALGLGARPWRTFRRVTLPLIMPGVVAGAIFAFITSWDEVVVAIFMTTSSLRTIPVLVWGQMRTEISPAIAAVGTILIVISVAGLGAISLLKRKERP